MLRCNESFRQREVLSSLVYFMNWQKDRARFHASLEALNSRLADFDGAPNPLIDRSELVASIGVYERLIGLIDAEIDKNAGEN